MTATLGMIYIQPYTCPGCGHEHLHGQRFEPLEFRETRLVHGVERHYSHGAKCLGCKSQLYMEVHSVDYETAAQPKEDE